MSAIDEALARLRDGDALARAGITPADGVVHDDLLRAGIGFATVGDGGGAGGAGGDGAHGTHGALEERWHRALAELRDSISPFLDTASPASPSGEPLLREGGPYPGAWLESTATISAELLDRFAPSVTRATHLAFAAHRRDDGLLPYKLTADGPAFTQIQTVTPLARGVWNHYLLTGRDDREYLETMYDAMARNDAWLAAHRDTRGTGAVEAFATFDTGHDLSPRFWGVPDRCLNGDAARYDPEVPGLPYIAPDLTANIACQREYLGLIAAEIGAELGDGETEWSARAAASLSALFDQCWDSSDETFYDRAADGSPVRVSSDVLLRVLACEVGDDELFERALDRYLMNTRRFLSAAGFTSIAMDDPRFDRDHRRNSWAGPVNFLTLVRAAHAFERHGRVAELALVHRSVLGAVAGHDRFPQTLDPFSGDAGYASGYSPAMLWLLDAVERDAGVLPRPDGTVWLTGLAPTRLGPTHVGHPHAVAASAASRTVRGVQYELAADDERVEVHRDGAPWLRFPRGWRVVLGTDGEPREVVGMVAGRVAGTLERDAAPTAPAIALPLELGPNDRAVLIGGEVAETHSPGFTPPRWGDPRGGDPSWGDPSWGDPRGGDPRGEVA